MTDSYFDLSDYTQRLFLGRWETQSDHSLTVHEIATQEALLNVAGAVVKDVATAAVRAEAAQKKWAALPFSERADVLQRATQIFAQQREAFHAWLVKESGSTQIKAGWEVEQTYRTLQQAIGYPATVNGEVIPSTVPGRVNIARRIPIGVIGVITPWNFPLLLAIRSVAPALALGNAVILKPDVQTPIAGGVLLARLFADAGLPEGLLHVLPGDGEVGAEIVSHPKIKQISFTGSTAVGRQIATRAGEQLKKATLELGGNNAYIVLGDADLDIAASHGAWGAFLHQGQICLQSGRHLVQRSLYDRYVKLLAEKASKLIIGDPTDPAVQIGPLINHKQLQRLTGIIETAIAEGAQVITGGEHDGLFYKPTVLANVDRHNIAFNQELFGPVAPVTAFDSDEELIELVNSSPWGLSVAIQSRDIFRAQGIIDQIDHTGMAHINDQSVNNEAHVPFGGLGDSGIGGKFGGNGNIETFTQVQWLSINPHEARYPY